MRGIPRDAEESLASVDDTEFKLGGFPGYGGGGGRAVGLGVATGVCVGLVRVSDWGGTGGGGSAS